MEKQRGRKKGERQRDGGTGESVTKQEGKESLQGGGKERKRQRDRPPVEGTGRREKAPSLKALPPSLQEQLRNGRREEEAEMGKVTR